MLALNGRRPGINFNDSKACSGTRQEFRMDLTIDVPKVFVSPGDSRTTSATTDFCVKCWLSLGGLLRS